MHYLDDFIDLLEQMPQMVRDKCTQLRELDLSLHNSSARLNQQVKEFFSKSEKMSQDEKNNLFQRVMCDYYRLLEDADERVRLAQEMLDYVRCHLVAINEELVKYQAELEADRPGITVILQKRSLLLDQAKNGVSKERLPSSLPYKKRSQNAKKQVLYLEEACVAATKGLFLLPPASPANFPGGSAIATAASQTITATQQMQQGWRSTSLKASYEALSLAVQEVDFGKKELVVAARTAVAAVQNATKKKKKKQKRKSPVGASMLQCMDTTAEVTTEWQKEWVPAPDEPTYCTCKQVSYGNMVACDNETCEIEWFHYSCVGILAPPKGKWYCPQCSIAWTKSGSHKAG